MRRLRDCLLYNPSVVLTNDSTPASPAELHTGEPKMKKAPMWASPSEPLRGPGGKAAWGIVLFKSYTLKP